MNKVDIYIDAQRLDLFQDEEITLVRTVQNVQDISKIFTDFSQTFTVPASATNNAIFSHYYRTDVSGGFDGRIRVDSTIELNSIPFRNGVIQMEGVQIKNNEPYAYSITFYGGLVSLSDLFGEDYLYDLDFSAYDHTYDAATVLDYFSTNSKGTDLIYPFMSPKDNWYYDTAAGPFTGVNLTPASTKLEYYMLKPALQVKKILDAIAAEYGITFSGSFLSSDPFQKLYLWLHRREGYMYENQPAAMAWEKVVADVDNAPVNDIYQFSDDEFEPTISGVYNFQFSAAISGYTDDWEFAIIDTNGDQVISQITLNGGGSGGIAANLVAGRAYYFAIRPTTTATSPALDYQFTDIIASRSGIVGLYIDIEQTSSRLYGNTGNVFVSEQMPEIKVKDFLAGIVKMYNLVIVPTSATEFLIQPLNDWYAAGTDQNYQTYIDVTEYAVNRPELYREIEFKYQDTEQILGYTYERTYGTAYGELRAFLSFDGEEFIIELPFECPLFERLSNLDTQAVTNLLTYKSITSEVNEDGTYNPYLGAPILFYADWSLNISANQIGFITDPAGPTIVDVSEIWYCNTSSSPTSAALSDTIVFGADIDPYHLQSINNNLYNDYWQDYIVDLYDKQTRIFTLDAILPLGEIIKMDLKNALIWNNQKYRINSATINLTTGKVNFELLNVV